MTMPRLEIRLDLIAHNARVLVDRLAARGIVVCGVTKATGGSSEVAAAMLAAGVASIGESRLENVEALRRQDVTAEVMLVRSPAPSQVARAVRQVDLSLNSEMAVIDALSLEALRQGRRHGVVLMVELGDLREGLMPDDVARAAEQVLTLPGVKLRGLGANLACQSGVVPDAANMQELTNLVVTVEERLGVALDIVSGGNSANLGWALDERNDLGRINHLRLGEAILLGVDPIDRSPIHGLRTDAFALVGEVIESKCKPAVAWGTLGQTAFGPPSIGGTCGEPAIMNRVIIALGRQDIEPAGLVPPVGVTVLGASSDHLVLDSGPELLPVGAEIGFGVHYSALLRASTSPSVESTYRWSEGSDGATAGAVDGGTI